MTRALLKRTLGVQSHSRSTERMQAFIIEQLHGMGADYWVDDGNVYGVKGEADVYPCIVAHTDTVHRIIPDDNFHVMEAEGIIFGWNSAAKDYAGIGGDDKVGVYIALALMHELPACKAVFFRDEEIGCQGARRAKMEFFKDCAFALEADRRGDEDVVVRASGTDLTSDAFNVAIFPSMSKFDRRFSRAGLMTDVQELKEIGLNICAINASCGYYRPHSDEEYVVVREVMKTKRFFKDICVKLGHKRWLHTAPTRQWVTAGYRGYGWSDWSDDDDYAGYTVREVTNSKRKVSSRPYRYRHTGAFNIWDKDKKVTTRVLPKLSDLPYTSCPSCWTQSLYWDSASEEVYCMACEDYVNVTINEMNIEELEEDALVYRQSSFDEEFDAAIEAEIAALEAEVASYRELEQEVN